jgi:hypothetical protein
MLSSLRRRIGAALTVTALAVVSVPALAGVAAAADPAPPFNQCPAVGLATSCGVLLVFEPDGSVHILSNTTASGNPYDGNDDTEIGVLNDSGTTIPSVTLSAPGDIFGFDGDGICSGNFTGTPAGCPFDTTGYAGPGITYSNINAGTTSGTVTFADSCTGNTTASCTPTSGGLVAGDSAFFSLETDLSGATITIPKANPVIQSTTPSPSVPIGGTISDSAVLANGRVPAGTLTFTLYGPGDTTCATPISTLTKSVSGNGTYASGPVTATALGTYRWVVKYGGDANNNPAGPTACGGETVTVTKATPALATTPSGSVPAGGTVSDSATLTGGFSPTGTITFTLYGPGDTTCTTPIATSTAAVSGDGTYHSAVATTGAAGTYNWAASYGGDAANNAVGPTACGAESVTVTPQIMTGRAYGLSASASTLGLQLVNIAPIPDTGSVSTSAATTTAPPCVASLSGLITAGVLCAKVVTSLGPSGSVADASVDSTTIGVAALPVITVGAVQSESRTTCAGSSGTTTIAYLAVGGVVVISKPTPITPNTKLSVLGVSLTLDEQTPVTGGLTVNAVHVSVIGLVNLDVVLASSTSDIHNCP